MFKQYCYSRNASLAPPHLRTPQEDFELIIADRDNNQQKSPEYLALNPAERIPTLVHDDLVVVFESTGQSTPIPYLERRNRVQEFGFTVYSKSHG